MRKRKVDKRRWYFALFNLLLLVLAAACGGALWWMTGVLNSLDAARQWQGSSETPFAQIACFLPEDGTKTTDEIDQFRRTLEQKLTEASLEAPKNGSLYCDAWSAEATLNVSGTHGSADVKTVGVGGNFFLFHPLQLRSGSYLSQQDFMQDRVVLDEITAWTLFGSSDVAGMSVTVEGKPCYVASNGSVHAWRIAAGGQNTDTVDCVFHTNTSFQRSLCFPHFTRFFAACKERTEKRTLKKS